MMCVFVIIMLNIDFFVDLGEACWNATELGGYLHKSLNTVYYLLMIHKIKICVSTAPTTKNGASG